MANNAISTPLTKPGAKPPYAIVAADLVLTGGMDRANLALGSYLARQGHALHAVTHSAQSELAWHRNVVFHRVPKPLNSYLVAGPLLASAGRRVADKVAAAGGRVVVNGGNCGFGDINWVHYVHAAYTPAGVSHLARRAKTALMHRAYLAAEAKCVRGARVVIANSNRTRWHLIDRLGVPEDRIHTIYYGNDPQAFFPPTPAQRAEIRERLQWPADRPVAIFIGALGDQRKGFDLLFSAWLKLCEQSSWDADLVVVGTGGELSAWKHRASHCRLTSRMRFLGFRRDIPDLLRAADVLVAPTRYESYGLGVQEALCCGLPALVSADSGVAERYPDLLQSLLIPDSENVGELASKLVGWRENLHRLREAVGRLFGEMRQRSWDQMAQEIVEAASVSDF
jgi:glycosyltransferase involved in cell wall biosynthesis